MSSVAVMATVLATLGGEPADTSAVQTRLPCAVEPQDFQTVAELLGRWADHRRRTRQIPGLVLALVCGTEDTWAAGYGSADPTTDLDATPSTPFRIASISKVLTATAVLALRDRGLLELDAPVTRYLPDFRPRTRWPDRQVAVEDLLSHASGLPSNSTASDFNRMVHPSGERMMELLAEQSLLFEPGTGYHYTNLGYAVLGRVASAVAGKSFAAVVRDEVLDPLGMRASSVHPEAGIPLARGHGLVTSDGGRTPADPIELDAFTPAGGMVSTAQDLAAFVALQLEAESRPGTIAPATVAEMQRIHNEVADGVGVGLGWAVSRESGGHEIYHGGELPSQTSHVVADLRRGYGAVVLTNARDGEPAAFASEAMALLALAERAAAEAPAADARSGSLGPFAGRFFWQDWEMWTIVLGRTLYLVDPTASSAAASASPLVPLGDGSFRISGSRGLPLRIVLDAEGRPTRLEMPSFTLFSEGGGSSPGH